MPKTQLPDETALAHYGGINWSALGVATYEVPDADSRYSSKSM
jgi:hypothetical protein